VGARERFEGFPRAVFARRRRRVLQELGEGTMVLPAAPILHRTGDTELRYRADSELFYLTGFIEPEAVLVLRGFADEDRSVLFVRSRDEKAERWTGPRVGPAKARSLLGVDATRPYGDLLESLPGLLSGADRVFFRLGRDPAIDRSVVGALELARTKGQREGKGPKGVVDPGEILDELRLRKDAAEIEALREAASVTAAAVREGIGRVTPGVGEWEIEAEVEAAFRRRGAAGPAFPTIVGSGANACTLHYVDNSRRMEKGDLVLIDAGAERRMYPGDVTRTVPVSGHFSSSQADVYRVVEAARLRAVEAVAPGVPIEDVHRAALTGLVEGLVDLGVLRGHPESLIARKAHEPYFPHRTSHWLGLDTHDVGTYTKGGASRLLEPGMVLTVEPGLYFPTTRNGRPFTGIGVRIEDDVLVTEMGGEVLTAALPTRPNEISALVGASARASARVKRRGRAG
jgi:Xaa-Pro aminopeptidase